MTGKERRDYILTELMASDTPISASNFAKRLQVSRQVIVNDVALLRANNHVIEATNKGYIIRQSAMVERVLKMQHTDADIEKELENYEYTWGRIIEAKIDSFLAQTNEEYE